MTVLKSAANAKVKRSAMPSSPSSIPVIMPTFNRHLATELICIGSSTGGPAALQAILPRFPKETNVPILVAQHMPPGFTKPFAERFNNLCQMPVKEAEDGEVLKVGVIYICPSGFQTTVQRTSEGVVLKVESNAKYKALYEPSVDVVISSLVPVFGPKLLTVILTGMGNDGMEGCKLAKKAGGHVVVESEDSCVVYGMPRSVYESGASHAKLHLGEIFNYISHFIEKR
jgi:two-component system chemotaxis response regulator CheB